MDQHLFNVSNNSHSHGFRHLSTDSIRIFLIGISSIDINRLIECTTKSLGYRFININDEIKSKIRGNNENDSDSFRKLQLNTFMSILENLNNINVIIWCGDNLIDTVEIRDILRLQKFVVYLNQIQNNTIDNSTFADNNRRTSINIHNNYENRKLVYRQCSQYEFCILKDENDWTLIEKHLCYFLKTITNNKRRLKSDPSFFLSLTSNNLLTVDKDKFQSIVKGCDAIELRIDLLDSYDIDFIGQQISYIRKNAFLLPIIYTVRSQSQYGKFINDEQLIFHLLTYGIRFGCEIIDVETCWNDTLRYEWLNKNKDKHANIIGSIHAEKFDNIEQMLMKCSHNGLADIIKIVINSIDIKYILQFTSICKSFKLESHQNILSLCMGNKGKLTRVLNVFMTPVTHPLLSYASAKGQMSVEETQLLRQSLGLLESKKFYLFGKPIEHSLTQLLHQTGFDYFYLPYNYELCETDKFDMIESIIKQTDFGGASIAMSLKQFPLELIDYVNESVNITGIMNTIVKLDNGQLYGDNTYWKAIYTLLDNILVKSIRSEYNVLILGTSGMARTALYTLKKLQFTGTIFLYNPRNPAKAKELAKDNIIAVNEQSFLENQNIYLIISTLPSISTFTFEEKFFFHQTNNLPILFDVNYVPYHTCLTRQAQKFNCRLIRGIDMFIEQRFEQFQLWTNKVHLVRSLLEQIVKQKYDELYIQSFDT
ncbi:unnamed protein product [Rotaria sordida]|uniref:Shikimate dehydrogenase substrate binding N-terminal domain-containing protein n=1 Tax=Rotaria sordida TaxID=392033 RepID=A0A814LH52_9BILA|nr:unnamed protein product [Rotaria sordida]CAF3917342.1 unnamed protein product [Rotaria sordida]